MTAGGECGEFGAAAAAGRPDEAQDGRLALLECVQLGTDADPFDRFHDRLRAVAGRRGGGEPDQPGEVEVGPVRGDRGRVLHEQRGEGGDRGTEGDGETDVGGGGAQRGAEDADDGAGRRVEHGAARRPAAEPQRVPPGRAHGQFQGAGDAVGAVGGGVRGRGRPEHPRLAPAPGGDPHVRAGPHGVPRGDGERGHAEVAAADQGQAEGGQRDDGVGGHDAVAALRAVQHETGQAVDGLVAGDHGAVAIGDEAGAAGAAGQVVERDKTGVRGGPEPLEGVPRGVERRHHGASCRAVPGALPVTLGPRRSAAQRGRGTRPLPLPRFTPSART